MISHKSRANRLVELQKVLVQLAEVERHIYFPDGKAKDRKENDVEHSYNLAIAAWYLAGQFPKLDRDKLLRYALAHDFVEVHASDVMAIGRTKKVQEAKQAREAKALKQLQTEWPDFSELTDAIIDYERLNNDESRFIYALDKLMPMILNIISAGKTWKSYAMKRQDVFDAKDDKVTISPEINELWQVFRKQIIENPSYFAHDKDAK